MSSGAPTLRGGGTTATTRWTRGCAASARASPPGRRRPGRRTRALGGRTRWTTGVPGWLGARTRGAGSRCGTTTSGGPFATGASPRRTPRSCAARSASPGGLSSRGMGATTTCRALARSGCQTSTATAPSRGWGPAGTRGGGTTAAATATTSGCAAATGHSTGRCARCGPLASTSHPASQRVHRSASLRLATTAGGGGTCTRGSTPSSRPRAATTTRSSAASTRARSPRAPSPPCRSQPVLG
mmetsp:Transcript_38955/g.90877  ORF Transcript_38955/g.90877 Transcript_38955/m.90877 type:complete len:242 (+) Transcript_38955:69-794(+)